MPIEVKLKRAMEEHLRRTGERLTYPGLARLTGLSRATLEAMGSRGSYNPTLATIEKLCLALNCQPGDLLELPPEKERDDAHSHPRRT